MAFVFGGFLSLLCIELPFGPGLDGNDLEIFYLVLDGNKAKI